MRLDPSGRTAVERGARQELAAARNAGHAPDGVLVQRMAEPGTELVVGVAGDPRFGPLVAVGAGGATATLIGDVQARLAPVGRREAGAMLRGLRTFPLLDGLPRTPTRGLGAIEDVVLLIAGPGGGRRARLQPGGGGSYRCRGRGRPASARAATRAGTVRGGRPSVERRRARRDRARPRGGP